MVVRITVHAFDRMLCAAYLGSAAGEAPADPSRVDAHLRPVTTRFE